MKVSIHTTAYILGITVFLFLLAGIHQSFAQEVAKYVPLVGIPGIDTSGNSGLVDYLNALFVLTISLGALAAVIKIAIAGFKWMMTDSFTTKGDARADITGALLGLGILLATFVVLNTINPDITNLDILSGAEQYEPVEIPESPITRSTEEVESENFFSEENAKNYADGKYGEDCRATGSTPEIKPGNNKANLATNRSEPTYIVYCPEPREESITAAFSGTEEKPGDNERLAKEAVESCRAIGGSADAPTKRTVDSYAVTCEYEAFTDGPLFADDERRIFEGDGASAAADDAVAACTGVNGQSKKIKKDDNEYEVPCVFLSGEWEHGGKKI